MKITDIKEVSGSLSADQMRLQYNENFRVIREILKKQNSDIAILNQSISQSVIKFPENPNPRITYIVKFVDGQWRVIENLGTQYIFENGEDLKVGSKHQHIVKGNVQMNGDSVVEIIGDGELIILPEENYTELLFDLQIEVPNQTGFTAPYNMQILSFTPEDGRTLELEVGGQPINVGETIQEFEFINVSSNQSGIISLKCIKVI